MLEPIEEFRAVPHVFGNEIDIRWQYPESIQDSHKLYVFKKMGKDSISDEEVQKYIADPKVENISEGCFVWYKLTRETEIRDYEVFAKTGYNYKAILVDKNDLGNISEIVSCNVDVPEFEIEVNTVDVKKIIIEGLQKIQNGMFKHMKAKLDVLNDFPIESPPHQFIAVTRSSGENSYRFWNDSSYETGSLIKRGEVETDVIQVTWMCLNNPTLRDKITQLMRAIKPILRRYCITVSNDAIKDISMVIIGDGRDGEYQDGNYVYGAMLINALTENQISQKQSELITQITYEFEFNIEGAE